MGVSDLTGQMAEENELGTLVVLEHPDLAEGPVIVEALAEEVKTLPRLSVPVAIVEWKAAGEETSRRYVVPADAFNALATGGKMGDVLAAAQPVKAARRSESGRSGGNGTNYATLERCGEPHRGRVTEEEKRLVRENLEAVNARLAAAGHRTIDPSDPKMRERYGFS